MKLTLSLIFFFFFSTLSIAETYQYSLSLRKMVASVAFIPTIFLRKAWMCQEKEVI
jgi:hypothetical protein